MTRVLFIADQVPGGPRGGRVRHPGGAEQSDAAALAACPYPVVVRLSREVQRAELARFDLIVLGNSERAPAPVLDALAQTERVVSFEHDLRICRWRGNFPAAREPVHALTQRCICPHPRLARLYQRMRGVIYLTLRQRRAFERNPFFAPPPSAVLGSSLFDPADIDRLLHWSRHATSRGGARYLGAPDAIKGTAIARQHCCRAQIEAAPIENVSPTQVHTLLGQAECFVHLPLGLEPAGRMPVEARLAGCRVVVNQNVGVAGEAFWRGDRAGALQQLLSAPGRFWQLVEELMARPAREPGPAPPRAERALDGVLALARRASLVLPPAPSTRAIRARAFAGETFEPW